MEIHWTQYLTALLTPVIALFGSLIAFMQWKLARNKLKLDLFDKRYVVYKACTQFISAISTTGESSNEEQAKFLRDTSDAKWLFNLEVAKYLNEILWKTAIDIETLSAEISSAKDPKRGNMIRERADKKIFLNKQYARINELFEPFMFIKH